MFISYKSEDKSRVRAVVEALSAEGFDLWWDVHLGGGGEWREEIQQNLEAARCVVVMWTAQAIGPEGRFVRDEASWALRNGTYLPVRLDDVTMPLGFGETQAIPLMGWKGRANDPQFQALVDAIKARLEGRTLPQSQMPRHQVAGKALLFPRRTMLLGGAVLGAAAAAGGGYWLTSRLGNDDLRIAVMPFENLSGDTEKAYFADGLADELRSALARAGLPVIARASSESVAKESLATIVKRLSATHIVTGSVQRSNDLLRITARLVDTASEIEKWAGNYDRSFKETIAVQSEIASQVAAALKMTLGPKLTQLIELGSTSDPVAQDLFMQAMQIRIRLGATDENIRKEAELLDKVLARDPKYAIALVERGRTENNIAAQFTASPDEMIQRYDRAEQFVSDGLRIAPNLALGFGALSTIAASRLRFRDCLSVGRKAFALGPNNSRVIGSLLNDMPNLAPLGEVESLVDRIATLDPLNPETRAVIAEAKLVVGKDEEALLAAEGVATLAPGNPLSNYQLARVQLTVGRNEDAEKTLASMPGDHFYVQALLAILAARQGNSSRVAELLGTMESQLGTIASYQLAQVHAQAGNADAAISKLAAAERVRDPGLIYLKRDRFLVPLHADARFAALLNRLDFPAG